jgi:hypothetical protein
MSYFSSSSTPLIDEETRQMVIKKTWCHGQLVAPMYSIVLLWWYFAGPRATILWFPILYFPCWCYWSYKNVFGDFSFQQVLAGGILAELCHAIVLILAIRAGLDQSTSNLIICIAAGLFLIETAAFLCVVTALRASSRSPQSIPSFSTNTASHQDEQHGSSQPFF